MKIDFKIGYLVMAIERPKILGGVTFRFLVVLRGWKYFKYKKRGKKAQTA